jgi:hypothetical protein
MRGFIKSASSSLTGTASCSFSDDTALLSAPLSQPTAIALKTAAPATYHHGCPPQTPALEDDWGIEGQERAVLNVGTRIETLLAIKVNIPIRIMLGSVSFSIIHFPDYLLAMHGSQRIENS